MTVDRNREETGAQFKQRIEAIVTNRMVSNLTLARRLLLTTAAVAAASPICIGIANSRTMQERSQTGGDTGPKFEVASVKPADPRTRGMSFNPTPGNGLRATGVTLKTLIEFAYDVQDFQVSGGPGWFGAERYDIVAKPERPDGPADLNEVTDDQQRLTLQRLRLRVRALLAERFQLIVHRETGDRPVYLLVLAKNGWKLQESPDGGAITRDRGQIIGSGATMELLAKVLSSTLGRPVRDRTGLNGQYKFKLEWTEDSASIFAAIQEQLGLKLESGKGPVEIIVIDHAEKPAGN